MKILIVDDHTLFVDGLCLLLRKLAEQVEIITSDNASEAIQIIETDQTFDLILIDLNMPDMNGLSILQRMRERKICLPFVVISSEDNTHVIKTAIDSGALGFIPKSHDSEQMRSALLDILDGDVYLPPELERRLEQLETQRPPPAASENSALKESGISKRQYEVLKLMVQGYSNKKIATTLFLSENTVKSHVGALFKTLNASNRTECVSAVIQQNLLSDDRVD